MFAFLRRHKAPADLPATTVRITLRGHACVTADGSETPDFAALQDQLIDIAEQDGHSRFQENDITADGAILLFSTSYPEQLATRLEPTLRHHRISQHAHITLSPVAPDAAERTIIL